ncbi:Ion channel [Oesophagostomum dentatum]|uniref:Ion channel n=1 Tax=Oesophagostomum dentatum TaxID=61180 RepID=A0A0B1TF72_OESDE|nr:Ion channel [Oesophagostomum dentatum]
MRGNLVAMIRAGGFRFPCFGDNVSNTVPGRGSKEEGRDSIEGELYRFNDKIYKAFKEQYVRYADVRVTPTYTWMRKEDGDRPKRHRNTKLRGEKGEKMWTASSALFFAATTMATIGYGNIVPATSSGRIACVVFALFGAPLAIITIGDLGKFLSECTIWLYKEMKKVKALLRAQWRRFRGLSKENQDAESQSSSAHSLDWEDLVMDKTEVPVFMVFTILLLYIAFGGILFSFLEGWTYMDAFYYSSGCLNEA